MPPKEIATSTERDQLIAEFQREVEQAGAEAVAKKLTVDREVTRSQAFDLLLELTQHYCIRGEPETAQRLIDGCRDEWEVSGITLAQKLLEKGREDLARPFFDSAFHKTQITTYTCKMMFRAFAVADKLQYPEACTLILEALASRFQSDKDAIAEYIGIAHEYARTGRIEAAQSLWQRLLETDPQLHNKYVMFMLRYRSTSELDTSENKDAEQSEIALMLERAKLYIKTEKRGEIAALCRQTLVLDSSEPILNIWMCLARDAQEKYLDLRLANNLWATILDFAPHQACSFLTFSRKHNKKGKDSDVDELIRNAHEIISELPARPRHDRRVTLKRASVNQGDLYSEVTIGKTVKFAQHWLSEAGMHIGAGENQQAFAIWMPVLQQKPSVTSSITRGMIKMIEHLDDRTALRELRIEQLTEAVKPSCSLYRSLASNVREERPQLAHAILETVHAYAPEDAGSTYALARSFARQGKWNESAQVWLPVTASYAISCSRFASELMEYKKQKLASALCREIMKVNPYAIIRFCPQYLLEVSESDPSILVYAQSILPTGKEKTLTEEQRQALKILSQSGWNPNIMDDLIRKLVGKGALRKGEGMLLSSTKRG
ncbi:MAG TPA: hypothetical protein VI913_02035 [Candidatus Peribacteraceae bacterium]|nr:hypothetical protein [Candidatus Peribacteraceae bacterium]